MLDEHSLPYLEICGEHSLDRFRNHIHYGYQSTLGLLQRDEELDAIFAINDEMALGALRACVEAGLRVPEDVGIIGFDNLELDACLPISLSSVQQPKFEMGSEAAKLLIAVKMRTHDSKTVQKQLQPHLVVRESARRQ